MSEPTDDRTNRLRTPPEVHVHLHGGLDEVKLAHFPTELTPGTDALLGTEEVAAILGLSVAYLRGAGADLLPIVRVGRRIRYRLSDLLALIERSTTHREPDPLTGEAA